MKVKQELEDYAFLTAKYSLYSGRITSENMVRHCVHVFILEERGIKEHLTKLINGLWEIIIKLARNNYKTSRNLKAQLHLDLFPL